MDWARVLAFVTGMVDQELLARIEYLACRFRKFDPAWIRVVRQNHRIIWADACNPALARNVRRRLVQAAMSA